MPERKPVGVFVGLATLDVIHRVERHPGPNEKITSIAQFVAAGGPAANAAVTFAALGGSATLLSAVGSGPVAEIIRAELAEQGVRVIDVAPEARESAPLSSVAVIEATGERSVIGGDGASLTVAPPNAAVLESAFDGAEVVLIDGHHPSLARAAAVLADQRGLPTVLDAGRWKPIMARLFDRVSDVVMSADFRTPGAENSEDTAQWLVERGVPHVVATAGEGPVQWWSAGGTGASPVPQIQAVDTLGAGDVFHGAYAYAIATDHTVSERVAYASEIAAIRCAHVGPRSWLSTIRKRSQPPHASGGA